MTKKISPDQFRKMKNSYRHDVAKHLAELALEGKTITYGQLAERFGGVARGWGNALGGIAIRCSEAGLPILSVLVVDAATRTPSTDAVLYKDLGLQSLEDIKQEQARCFAFDWASHSLLSGRTTATE
jgi:hypothetical protein